MTSVQLINKSHADIEQYSQIYPDCIVSFSGGKDSLAVLDIAKKYHKKVVCFYMYWIKDLPYIEKQLNFAEEKYGVEILRVPHWGRFKSKKYGHYCQPNPKLTDVTLADVYYDVRKQTGIELIYVGAKKSDSQWRRTNSANKKHGYENVIYPIFEWDRYLVVAYLKKHGIPIPESEGNDNTGADLSHFFITWLHDNKPDDYQVLLKDFPLAHSVIIKMDMFK
jgi:3'-phosphoadenosine 5'-phosphosulfate sulfotransferase (PAPS reductase)/FAD synthetase